MSTPLSPGSKLEGLEVYAPRRAATAARQASSPSQDASPELADDLLRSSEEGNWRDAHDEAMQAAQARLDDAIQAAVTLAYGPRSRCQPESAMRPLLEPDVLPEPPVETRWRSARPTALRYALCIGFAALTAYGITVGPSFTPAVHLVKGGENDTRAEKDTQATVPAPEPSPPRLIVDDRQVFANEPLPLGLSVEHAKKDALIRLAGLASGTRLSAGAPIDNSSWKLPIPALKDLYLYAPANFVGVMHAGIDLLSRDDRLMDQRAVRLEWLPDKPEPPQPVQGAPANVGVPPVQSSVVQPIDPDLVSALMSRGRNFLATGDIEAARIAFGRLAEAGVADAAFAEATTYDYRYLVEHHVLGVRGDQAKARALYQRAAQLGSKDAGVMLARMQTQ